MRRAAAVVALVALLLAGACGGGGRGDDDDPVVLEPNQEEGLTLGLSHSEPLRAGAPVIWALQVRNGGQEPVTLSFGSGQRGEVVLTQGSAERYRWSRGRAFTQALGEVPLAPGQAESFELKDDSLGVEPGRYDLVASLRSQPSPAEVRRTVTVGP